MATHFFNRLMFAPDVDTGGGASTLTVPNVTLDIPDISSTPNHPPAEIIDLPSPKIPGYLSPKEALGGDDPRQEREDMEADMMGKPRQPRGPDGKFLTKAEKAVDAKIADVPVPEKGKPAPKTKPATKVAEKPIVSKFKIGDVEKTPDEWAAHFKDLEEKAKPAETPKPAEPTAPSDNGEKARDEAFLAKAAERYTLPSEELDDILSGGPKAAEKLALFLAKQEMVTRKTLVNEFNRVLAEQAQRVDPLLSHHQQIADYQRDQSFLESNPDIKTHPEGYATYKTVEKEIRDGYALIQSKVANNTATPVERAWATIYENQPPEQFQTDLAAHTRVRLSAAPPAEAAPVAAAPSPKPPKQQPQATTPAASRPLMSDRPGAASGVVRTESEQARMLRSLNDYQGIH